MLNGGGDASGCLGTSFYAPRKLSATRSSGRGSSGHGGRPGRYRFCGWGGGSGVYGGLAHGDGAGSPAAR